MTLIQAGAIALIGALVLAVAVELGSTAPDVWEGSPKQIAGSIGLLFGIAAMAFPLIAAAFGYVR